MVTSRYIPKDATEIQHPQGLGVVYAYSANGKPLAVAYAGKANKSAWHNSFIGRDPEAMRQKRIEEFFAGLTAHIEQKAQYAAERNKPHSLQVGDVIHHSWGWEQTNCDYYQVIAVTAHGATIRAISNRTVEGSTYEHGMADMQIPVTGRILRRTDPSEDQRLQPNRREQRRPIAWLRQQVGRQAELLLLVRLSR